MTNYWFKIWQGGIVVASGSGPFLDDMGREMVHYAAQYAQDGPITIWASAELKPQECYNAKHRGAGG